MRRDFIVLILSLDISSAYNNIHYITEPHYRGLYRRALCSRVHLTYSLCQLRVGISPPYALDITDSLSTILRLLREELEEAS